MMSKYLRVDFESAKLFHNTKWTKDVMIDFTSENGYRRRDESFCFKEPLTVHQISNMIHVLFGERPSPTMRKTILEKDEYLFEKAKNSYLKLDVVYKYNKIKKEDEFIKEKMSTKKAVYNSWSNPYLNWEIVKRYMDDDIYFEFLKKVEAIVGYEPIAKPFSEFKRDIRQQLSSQKTIQIFDWLKKKTRSGIVDILNCKDESQNSIITRRYSNLSAITVLNGVEDVVNISGSILIPVTDEDIERINKFKGCCTILDGGLSYINGIFDANEISSEEIDKYRLVGSISLETIKYIKNEN